MIICLVKKINQELIFIKCYKRLLLTLSSNEVYLFNMYKSKVGLIGLGRWGKNIYRNLETLNVIEKVYDNNLKNLSQFLPNKSKIAKNSDELFLSKEIDCIFIGSPASTHKKYIIQSLLNNKNVFVEKPLCLSLDDAYEIKNISKEENKIVFVGHLLQYHNAFRELKKNVQSGKVGNIKIIKANRLNFGSIRDKESVLYDLTSHDISMILSITKELPKKVDINAIFKYSKKLADYINIILYFEKDIIAIINSDWISPYKEHRFSVFGSNGSLVFNDTKDWPEKLIYNPSFIDENKKINYQNDIFIHVKKHEPLKNEIETFLKCVENDETPLTNIEEALNVQIVLNMIEKKLKEKYF